MMICLLVMTTCSIIRAETTAARMDLVDGYQARMAGSTEPGTTLRIEIPDRMPDLNRARDTNQEARNETPNELLSEINRQDLFNSIIETPIPSKCIP